MFRHIVSINNHCKLLNVYVNVQKVFKLFKKINYTNTLFLLCYPCPTIPFYLTLFYYTTEKSTSTLQN